MKVSVITVSFNAVSCIERTIKSVISQRYNDFEYIIVDGQSNDGTIEIIQKYHAYQCCPKRFSIKTKKRK